ncbi:MAG: hypothetical protein SWH54_07460, partial [Thermodesulfobacteriota bacterium]|nr:hypothetical protein [Thermodesulfobacteriota bacterium]
FNELPMQVNYAFSGKSSFYFYAILHRKFKQFSIVVQTLIKSLYANTMHSKRICKYILNIQVVE